MNREVLHQAVQKRDFSGLPMQKLPTYSESTIPSIASGVTCDDSSYECYLCHHEYETLQALSRHLNSSIHTSDEASCGLRSDVEATPSPKSIVKEYLLKRVVVFRELMDLKRKVSWHVTYTI